jgi:hypothetical protein
MKLVYRSLVLTYISLVLTYISLISKISLKYIFFIYKNYFTEFALYSNLIKELFLLSCHRYKF